MPALPLPTGLFLCLLVCFVILAVKSGHYVVSKNDSSKQAFNDVVVSSVGEGYSCIIIRSQSVSEPVSQDYEFHKCILVLSLALDGQDGWRGLELDNSVSPGTLESGKTLIG